MESGILIVYTGTYYAIFFTSVIGGYYLMKWINISVPGGTVINSEQVNRVGSGIQFPLL